MPFTIHPVAPVFTAVAPLDGPSGVPGEDAQVFVVNAQPENGSWLADVAFDTQRRLEWIRRILETEQAYSVVERARIATGMALLGSFEVGRDKAKALKHTTATLHGARTKHDPRTGHLIGRGAGRGEHLCDGLVGLHDADGQPARHVHVRPGSF